MTSAIAVNTCSPVMLSMQCTSSKKTNGKDQEKIGKNISAEGLSLIAAIFRRFRKHAFGCI